MAGSPQCCVTNCCGPQGPCCGGCGCRGPALLRPPLRPPLGVCPCPESALLRAPVRLRARLGRLLGGPEARARSETGAVCLLAAPPPVLLPDCVEPWSCPPAAATAAVAAADAPARASLPSASSRAPCSACTAGRLLPLRRRRPPPALPDIRWLSRQLAGMGCSCTSRVPAHGRAIQRCTDVTPASCCFWQSCK